VATQVPFAIVSTRDQWLRCRHQQTSFDDVRGCVELAWKSESEEIPGSEPETPAAGLAFDPLCRLYHSVPADGRIEWMHWQADLRGSSPVDSGDLQELFNRSAPAAEGAFTPVDPNAGPLLTPLGLAADDNGHLFIAEAGRHRLLVYDIAERRLLRTVPLADPGALGPSPIDVAVCRNTAYVLTANPTRLLRLTARGLVHEEPLPATLGAATRVAVSPKGRIALLDAAADAVVVLDASVPTRSVGAHATDIEFESEESLVVAHWPGQDFTRLSLAIQPLTRPGLKARGYDGRGIVRTPDGRIGFWTSRGFRHAAPLRLRYDASGTVTTFRLDSQEYQTVWGRVYVDACVPDGTSIEVYAVASDEPPEELELPRTPPANSSGLAVNYPEASPPMPPISFAPHDDEQQNDFRPMFRRETGREVAWAPQDLADGFVTFEAPVHADAGRYLWITLKLAGTTRVTPRVKCLRAEYPAHDYLRRLPKVFSRDAGDASFLRRYLAIAEGFLRETDARAYERATLLDAWATPDEAVPWLASFVGLLLDERWARAPRPGGRFADDRRQLVAEANQLFRFRGTVCGLRRFLEIYTGADVTILEHFRVRGLGGALVGAGGSLASSATVGGGFRVGGSIGTADELPLAGTTDDAFRTHAHRFSVIAHTTLTGEQRSVVDHILEEHRPAHTIVELCTVTAGFRAGMGAHVGLSAIVGRSGAFGTLRTGAVFGRDSVLGRPVRSVSVGDGLDDQAWIG
jgi:phage tail-like protein